jgi:zinc protease
MSASGQPGVATFRIQSKRENLPAVLDVLRQVLREPSLPAKELDLIRASQLSRLKQSQSEPTTKAQNVVTRKISPFPKGHPRYVPTTDEEIAMIEAVTAADVKSLYKKMLNGHHGELTIVGDFDVDSTLETINRALADWNSEVAYEYVPNRGDFTVEPGYEQINTPDKANAMYFAATVFPLRDDHPDYPALTIANFILGSSGLSSRLGDRVRQTEGLSYGISSGLRASSKDKRAAFYVYAITNPANGGKVRTAIKEEIDRLQKDGITKQELDAAKAGYLQRQQVSRTNDGQLAAALGSTLFVDRTMQFTADQEARIAKLTVDEVNTAIRKYLSHDNLFVAMAGDFEKVASENAAEKESK